jgi:hypothetical protein
MALVGSVTARFASQTAEYSKGIDTARAKTNGFYRDVTQGAKESQKASQGFLKDLSGSFGRGSDFTKILKTLAGSGAVMGLNLLAKEALHFSEKMKDVAEASTKGADEQARSYAELLKSVPIVGKIGEALANIYDVASGTSAYVAELKHATDEQEKYTEWLKASSKAAKEFHADASKSLADIASKVKESTLNGLPLKIFQIDEKEVAAFNEIQSKLDKFTSSPEVTSELNNILKSKNADLQKQYDIRNNLLAKIASVEPGSFSDQGRNARFSKLAADAQKEINQIGIAINIARERQRRLVDNAEADSNRERSSAANLAVREKGKAYIEAFAVGVKSKAATFADAVNNVLVQPLSDFAEQQKEFGKQLDEEAKKAIESSETAAEKFQRHIELFKTLMLSGRLTESQYGRAVDKAAKEDFADEINARKKDLADSMRPISVQERSSTLTVTNQNAIGQLNELQKSNRYLNSIDQKIGKTTAPPATVTL